MSHAIVLAASDGALDGMEITRELARQMEPFDESGEWFKDGSRWDWYQVGGRYTGRLLGHDIRRVSEVSLDRFAEYAQQRYRENYEAALREYTEKKDAGRVRFMYDVDPELTVDQYLDVNAAYFHFGFPAFLHDRTWSENGRMGWFGEPAATECERATGEAPKKCTFKLPGGSAATITYDETDPEWRRRYYDRFIKSLDPATWLVVVDYHV